MTAIKNCLAATALLGALVTSQARADERAAISIGIMTVTIAQCIAPTTNASVEADFNYLADAMTLLGEQRHNLSVSKDEEDRAMAVASEQWKQDNAAFCERGKRAFDAIINTAREKDLPMLIEGRRAWGKLK
jgi:hypothetical protein